MRIYLIASSKNLENLKKILTEKYPKLEIYGSSDISKGIDDIRHTSVLKKFDALIIMGNFFINEDMNLSQELSKQLYKACAYSLKDIEKFFVISEQNKQSVTYLRTHLKDTDIKYSTYNGKLSVNNFIEIISEVNANKVQTTERHTDIDQDVLKAKLNKKEKQEKTSYAKMLLQTKLQNEEDVNRMDLLTKSLQKVNIDQELNVDKNRVKTNADDILKQIQNTLYLSRTAVDKDNKIIDMDIPELNSKKIQETLAPEKLGKELYEADDNYREYADFIKILTEAIEIEKNSDSPNKHETIMALMETRLGANNELNKILAEFTNVAIKGAVDTITENFTEEFSSLKEYGESIENGRTVTGQLASIGELKQQREELKEVTKHMLQNLHGSMQLTSHVAKQLTDYHSQEIIKLTSEYVDFATGADKEINREVVLKTRELPAIISKNNSDLISNVNSLISNTRNTLVSFNNLVEKDEEIIGKQDEVIDKLMTQKVVKKIVVSNVLQTMLYAVIGPDGVGKTAFAYSMAKALSEKRRVLLVDMNLDNPSLRFYNKKNEETDNPKAKNKQTMSMEEFITMGVHNRMYEDIPFDNNLTIIQPERPIDLDEYNKHISPLVFAQHVKMFLTSLSGFYEKIIVIFPEEMESMRDLMQDVSRLYLVTDFNPSKFNRIQKTAFDFKDELHNVLVKAVIMNKTSKFVNDNEETISSYLGIKSKDYNFFRINEYPQTVNAKLVGKSPIDENASLKQTINQISRWQI